MIGKAGRHLRILLAVGAHRRLIAIIVAVLPHAQRVMIAAGAPHAAASGGLIVRGHQGGGVFARQFAASLRERFGQRDQALFAVNGGQGGVQNVGQMVMRALHGLDQLATGGSRQACRVNQIRDGVVFLLVAI